MNREPFDREHQKSQLRAFRRNLEREGTCVCWLEGASGVGKTTLLKYATELCHDHLLAYAGGELLAKCQEAHMRDEFHFIANILASLQQRHTRDFNTITSRHFSRLEHAPLLESFVTIVPAIRGFGWVERLVSKRARAIERARAHTHEHLLTLQLTQLFTKIIVELIARDRSKQSSSLLIAIDDVCWIDQQSLQILKRMTLSLRESAIPVHFLVASRSFHSVGDPDHYALVEDTFKALATTFTAVPIHSLDRDLTRQFVSSSREDLSAVADSIYDITQGNLQELCQVLKMAPDDIATLPADGRSPGPEAADSTDLQKFYGSLHRIRETLAEKPLNLFVLVTLVALGNELSANELRFLVRSLGEAEDRGKYTDADINRAIEALSAPDAQILSVSPSSVRLAHDSTSALLTSVLESAGAMSKLTRHIVHVLSEDGLSRQAFGWPRALLRALELCVSADARGGLQIFTTHYESARRHLHYRTRLSELGAKLAVVAQLERLAPSMQMLLQCFDDLVSGGSYPQAVVLAQAIHPAVASRGQEGSFEFHLRLAIALRETDSFEGTSLTARSVIEDALELEGLTDSQRIRANTVYCSILEHHRAFDQMRDVYAETTALLERSPESHDRLVERVRHVRNLGLVQDHEDSVAQYEEAEVLSRQLDPESTEEQIIRASLINSLGLGHLRSGSPQTALEAFTTCVELMNQAYYPVETPLHNSAVCHAMMGDWPRALDYANSARSQVSDSPYRELSIDINLSVIYWKIGREEEAMLLARQVAGLEPSGRRSFNQELRLRSFMNIGFFLLQQGAFREAAGAYGKSMEAEIRLAADRERRRRQEMKTYCLARAGDVGGEALETLSAVDLFETSQIPIRRPYDLQNLALYFN